MYLIICDGISVFIFPVGEPARGFEQDDLSGPF